MKNFSNDKSPVTLNRGEKYIIIDALYWMDVVQMKERLDRTNLLDEMRTKVFRFPLTDTPFAELEATDSQFTMDQLAKVFEGEETGKDALSTDTALLLVAREDILPFLLDAFSYDDLIDDPIELFDSKYWDSLIDKVPEHSLALLVSPGIESGLEFDGSGRYRIRS